MTQSPYTILIVDDNRANLKILEATFIDEGYLVHTASKVESAQDLLREMRQKIDLVLSDIQMPGLTGFDLVRWLKNEESELHDTPILLITSQLPDAESRILGLSIGAVDYLLRSLDPQEIVLRVSHAIDSFKKVKRLQKNLVNTEGLAAAAQLLAANHHEVKNLAQVIRMGAGILEKNLRTTKDIQSQNTAQALDMIKHSSKMLCDLTKSMNGLVDKCEVICTTVNIASVTKDVLVMMKPMLREIEIDQAGLSDQEVWVNANETQSKQVLINLLINAKDALLEVPRDSKQIAIKLHITNDSTAVLSVTDNGSGFAPKGIRTDFPAFASTKKLRGGTGLGLWLSSRFMRDMGGTLTLTSQGADLGTTASLEFKRLPAPLKRQALDFSIFADEEFS